MAELPSNYHELSEKLPCPIGGVLDFISRGGKSVEGIDKNGDEYKAFKVLMVPEDGDYRPVAESFFYPKKGSEYEEDNCRSLKRVLVALDVPVYSAGEYDPSDADGVRISAKVVSSGKDAEGEDYRSIRWPSF